MERSTQPAASRREQTRSSAPSEAPQPSLAQAARQAAAVLTADERRQAAQALAHLAREAEPGAADGLESWLGPAPSNPVALELGALQQRFALRRQVLSRTLAADEVAELAGVLAAAQRAGRGQD